MKPLFVPVAVILALCASLFWPFAGGAPAIASGDTPVLRQITICHATGSDARPWIEMTVGVNTLEAHLGHGDFRVNTSTPCPP